MSDRLDPMKEIAAGSLSEVLLRPFHSLYADSDTYKAADSNKNCGTADCGNCKKGCGTQPK